MQKLAIDASTAAKWQLSAEQEAESARDMLRDYAAAMVTFVTPRLWHYEIANVINKAVHTRRLIEAEGQQAFMALQALDIEFIDWLAPLRGGDTRRAPLARRPSRLQPSAPAAFC